MKHVQEKIRAIAMTAVLVISFGFSIKGQQLKDCDLIFQLSSASKFSKAISGATAEAGELDFSHVGIIEISESGEANVIEASPEEGVRSVSLQEFLDNSPKIEGRSGVVIKRLQIDIEPGKIIETAKGYTGESYDWWYLPNNGKMYCSELVYESFVDAEGKHIFEATPMNFRNPDGSMPEFWTELFGKLGAEIPEGVEGTNPNGIARDKRLEEVLRYF